MSAKLERYVEKAFWAMLLWISAWVGQNINTLTKSVDKLNINMAVVVSKVQIHDDELKALKTWRDEFRWTTSRR